MKTRNIIKVAGLFLCLAILGSCKPEVETIFNMFDDVKVTFHGDDPLSVTDYKLVNDGDSAYIDYTVTSDKEDMYSITEERVSAVLNGTEQRIEIQLGEQNRRSYTGRFKLKMQRDGKSSFRVFARNRLGHYIGDGYKKVTIEGKPSYRVYATRRIFSPDTISKVMPAFISLSSGETFNYTEGGQNTDKIDLGMWRRVTVDAQNRIFITYNYYSLTAVNRPWTVYDISGWANPRATQFSNPVKGAASIFTNELVSGSLIETRAKAAGLAIRATNISVPGDGLSGGNVVYFLTPEGKYGAMLVNQVTEDLDKRPYLSVSVKIQN